MNHSLAKLPIHLAQVSDQSVSEAETTADVPEVTPTVTESLVNFWTGFLEHLPYLGLGLLVLIVAWVTAAIVYRVVDKVLERTRLRESLRELFAKMVYMTLWIVGFLAASMVVFPTLTPGRLLATLGLGSIAIGFAFKDIFENFFAGVLILWRFPFERGDFIEVNGITGRVEDIQIRMTLIRQTDGQLVLLPNATIFKNATTVLTNQDARRVTVICGVAYAEDVDVSRDCIRDAVSGCSTVVGDQPIEIFAQEFADSSVNFEVTWWCGSTPLEIRQSRDEVVAAVKRALDDAEIEIPFPYRTLTFSEPLKLSDRNGSDSSRDSENQALSRVHSKA